MAVRGSVCRSMSASFGVDGVGARLGGTGLLLEARGLLAVVGALGGGALLALGGRLAARPGLRLGGGLLARGVGLGAPLRLLAVGLDLLLALGGGELVVQAV